MLIDTHAHLYYDQFKPDLNQVIKRSLDNHVNYIINIGADLESSHKAVSFKTNQVKFFASVGLHPHEASKLSSDESIHENIEKLEKIYQTNPDKIVAIGECGLDYYFGGEEKQKEIQEQLFKGQIALAKRLNLPLIIHSRDSWEDIFLPELQGTSGVFHSFTGNNKAAKKVLDLGFYLGFSCIITYPKNEYLRQIIKDTPLNKILTETDCPFLPPQIRRGQRNEPASVVEVVKTIAEIKNISWEEVAHSTFQNAQTLLRLP